MGGFAVYLGERLDLNFRGILSDFQFLLRTLFVKYAYGGSTDNSL